MVLEDITNCRDLHGPSVWQDVAAKTGLRSWEVTAAAVAPTDRSPSTGRPLALPSARAAAAAAPASCARAATAAERPLPKVRARARSEGTLPAAGPTRCKAPSGTPRGHRGGGGGGAPLTPTSSVEELPRTPASARGRAPSQHLQGAGGVPRSRSEGTALRGPQRLSSAPEQPRGGGAAAGSGSGARVRRPTPKAEASTPVAGARRHPSPGGGGAGDGAGARATWANALWDQEQRLESLRGAAAAARASIKALRARASEKQRVASAHAQTQEEATTSHRIRMAALSNQLAVASEDLRRARADLEQEEQKGVRLKNGIEALGAEIDRRGQRLEGLHTKQGEQIAEAEAKAARAHALGEVVTTLQAGLAARAELRAQSVVTARKLHNGYLTLKGNIRVFCRFRPRLPREDDSEMRVDFHDDSRLTVHSAPQKSVTGLTEHSNSWDFNFDHVFGPGAKQAEVFEEISLLVQSALDGYRVAIFAYGQTGGGKTHTMEGPAEEGRSAEAAGVIPRAVDLIFEEVQGLRQKGWAFEVQAAMVEVYNEAVVDMLPSRGKSGGTPREEEASGRLPGQAVSGAADGKASTPTTASSEPYNWRRVQSAAAVHALLRRAARERHVASTACNDRSSRSHAVFQLSITGHVASGDKPQQVRGLLSLVDLAGSERVERSGATGERLREAQHINRSLSALGDVIEALSRRGSSNSGSGNSASASCHVPYRNSRLTMLLKDSLGGDSKALMFVNVSPCLRHLGETLSSLRFAAKVHACEVGVAKRNVADGSLKPGLQH